MTIEPTTTLAEGQTHTITVQVLGVKASEHSYFGPHDIVSLEVTGSTGDLPAGLRFSVRRPQDGTNDLRSAARKQRQPKEDSGALPVPNTSMTVEELTALCDARGLDTGAKPTKTKLLKLLG